MNPVPAIAAQDPFDTHWHLYIGGKTYGPYTGHEIREMVAERRTADTDLTLRQGSSNWVQAKDDPTLRLLFVSSKGSFYDAKAGRRINLIAGLIIIGFVGWIVWPYYAAYDLATAIKNGDEATLQNRVDWDSVRQSLRGDLNIALLKSTAKDQDNLGRGFAMMLGPTMVNQMVDGYVTPQAVARLMKEAAVTPRSGGSDDVLTENTTEQRIRQFSFAQVRYAFFMGNPLSFQIDVRHPDPVMTGVTTFFFKWSGDWHLTRVTLPFDDIEKFSAKKKPVEDQPPLQVLSTPKASRETVVNSNNSQKWGAMFKTQVNRCWKKPSAKGETKVDDAGFSVKLKRDGTLETAPVASTIAITAYSRVYQESALRAIVQCQPYKLPDAFYEEWKFFYPVFSERG